MENPLNKFFRGNGAETPNNVKKQFGEQLSKRIIDSLTGEGKKGKESYGSFNINGEDFDLYNCITTESAKKSIIEIEKLLDSPVGKHLSKDLKILLGSHMNSIKDELKLLGDEYDDYYSIDRIKFYSKTNKILLLKKVIDFYTENDYFLKEKESKETFDACKKRLGELQSN